MGAHRLKGIKTEKDLRKLKRKHSDLTVRTKNPTAEDRIDKMEKEIEKLKKQIATINAQSQKAYSKAINAEMRLYAMLTLLLTPDE